MYSVHRYVQFMECFQLNVQNSNKNKNVVDNSHIIEQETPSAAALSFVAYNLVQLRAVAFA